ncbi:MAG TPA: nuclear transport factor 2 family protein [Chloroflexota bacterium]|jgi:hypothetical protein|nr:nuclear transport factor 2 family protein [Chloroflexota bacterium]
MLGLEHLRLFRAIALVAGAFILLVQAAGAQGLNPAAVIDSYERAWAEQDIDTAQNLLADGAVITVIEARTRKLQGRDQIREFLQNGAPRALPILTTNRQIDGNTIIWSERTDGQLTAAGDLTVQAEIQNGKILSLVYRPGRMIRAAGNPITGSTTPESAGLALGAVFLFGVGLLSLVTSRSHVNAGSNLRGRLVHDLRHWRPRQLSS